MRKLQGLLLLHSVMLSSSAVSTANRDVAKVTSVSDSPTHPDTPYVLNVLNMHPIGATPVLMHDTCSALAKVMRAATA